MTDIMDNSRVSAMLDRMQEQLKRDPEELDHLLDIIEEVI